MVLMVSSLVTTDDQIFANKSIRQLSHFMLSTLLPSKKFVQKKLDMDFTN